MEFTLDQDSGNVGIPVADAGDAKFGQMKVVLPSDDVDLGDGHGIYLLKTGLCRGEIVYAKRQQRMICKEFARVGKGIFHSF